MYEAPIEDYKFVIDHVIGLNQLMANTGHDDIGIDLVEAVLSEAGKLAADVIAPLNHSGDQAGPHAMMTPVLPLQMDLPMPTPPWPRVAGPLWKHAKNLVDKIYQWL